jgi:nucleotide-binding universal stress UspA family protein
VNSLVYVDPSQRGEWALALAALVLPGLAERVVLLATEEDASRSPELLALARARLSGVASVEERVARGPAEKAIGSEVAQGRYEFVVVPPAGRNALQRMLKGSRVATVVRSVPASVLVARRPPERLERVLCALSGGPSSARVVATTLAFEKATGARARFFHVASEVALPFHPEGALASAAPWADPAQSARAALEPHGRQLLVREGLVVEEILAEVEHGADDLLVVGAPGAPAGAWTREDTTERLLLGCGTSVLIVR